MTAVQNCLDNPQKRKIKVDLLYKRKCLSYLEAADLNSDQLHLTPCIIIIIVNIIINNIVIVVDIMWTLH